MGPISNPSRPEVGDQAILDRAADGGFQLVQYETRTGQLVWEWRRGNEPRPQFVTRRVALHWMSEFLNRSGDAAIASTTISRVAAEGVHAHH